MKGAWQNPFQEGGAQSKERSPWPSQSRSQGKCFESSENSAERHLQPQKKKKKRKICTSSTFRWPDPAAAKAAYPSLEECPQEPQA